MLELPTFTDLKSKGNQDVLLVFIQLVWQMVKHISVPIAWHKVFVFQAELFMQLNRVWSRSSLLCESIPFSINKQSFTDNRECLVKRLKTIDVHIFEKLAFQSKMIDGDVHLDFDLYWVHLEPWVNYDWQLL